jgi:hypothetical protein
MCRNAENAFGSPRRLSNNSNSRPKCMAVTAGIGKQKDHYGFYGNLEKSESIGMMSVRVRESKGNQSEQYEPRAQHCLHPAIPIKIPPPTLLSIIHPSI